MVDRDLLRVNRIQGVFDKLDRIFTYSFAFTYFSLITSAKSEDVLAIRSFCSRRSICYLLQHKVNDSVLRQSCLVWWYIQSFRRGRWPGRHLWPIELLSVLQFCFSICQRLSDYSLFIYFTYIYFIVPNHFAKDSTTY